MRDIKFKNHPGTGPRNTSWEYASLDQFLLKTPLFFYELCVFGVAPPIHILNEKLKTGTYDAGMGGGCDWKPFEIDPIEYEDLVMELTTNPDHKIIEDDELWEKPNFKKWHGALLSKYAKKTRNSR